MSITAETVRRDNLKAIIECNTAKGKSIVDVYEKFGVNRKMHSGFVSGSRPMGKVIARRIEGNLGLPTGWMDQVHQEGFPVIS